LRAQKGGRTRWSEGRDLRYRGKNEDNEHFRFELITRLDTYITNRRKKMKEANLRQTHEDDGQPYLTVAEAWRQFLADAERRNLRPVTLYKYKLVSRQMEIFAKANGLRFLREFDLPMLHRFRASWPGHNSAVLTKLWCLRRFFRFALKCGWIEVNPAPNLAIPRVYRQPPMPFTPEQMARILSACDTSGRKRGGGKHRQVENARLIRAFVLLLIHTGLRLHEAVRLERESVTGDKLLVRSAKNGTPVYVPLPGFVLRALAAVPQISDQYFFMADGSRLNAAIHAWSRTLKAVFGKAGISDGNAYRFRHTFAHTLLLAGVPVEIVSLLLGHSSVRMTVALIAPMGQASQEQLDAYVRRSWESPAFKKLPARFRKRA
jgi:integrase/recombinase XerD